MRPWLKPPRTYRLRTKSIHPPPITKADNAEAALNAHQRSPAHSSCNPQEVSNGKAAQS